MKDEGWGGGGLPRTYCVSDCGLQASEGVLDVIVGVEPGSCAVNKKGAHVASRRQTNKQQQTQEQRKNNQNQDFPFMLAKQNKTK